MVKKYFIFLTFILFFLCFTSKYSFADTNFSTDYNVYYSVDNNANTHVKINVTLTNLSQRYYSPSYALTVGFKQIENLIASDSNGILSVKLAKSEKGTDINFNFNKPVTGTGNKQIFTVEFDTNEVAENIGNVWEVNIPGLSPTSDFTSFNATLIYPAFLGKPVFIKPNYPNILNSPGNTILFTKDELGKSGISVAFGSSQIYDFNLEYHLKNSNLFPIETEIALPPVTNYQDVVINQIIPRPVNVKEDQDGNWLAQYYLSPSKSLIVDVNGKAKVKLNGEKNILSVNQTNEYLKSQTYWEASSPYVKQASQNLKTPEDVYQFVVGTLNYDYSRASEKKPRLGASLALSNPNSAVCLEFTDLFIALSRSIGVPAREVDGYAYTKNSQDRPLSLGQDILHAWPEYYDRDKGAWIMVDPTWGNTTGGVDYFHTFDFDHLAFVVKGIDSTYPIPAGGYKIPGQKDEKDVDVKLSKGFNVNRDFDIKINVTPSILPFMPIKGEVVIENTGNSLLDPQEVKIISKDLNPQNKSVIISEIPPYGFLSVPIIFNNIPFLTNENDIITIQVGNKEFVKEVKISPLYRNIWILGGVIFVIFIIVISIITGRARRLPIS